ncbi:MAG: CBS domain-containing protein, partial [Blastocatellia bacterium]|nr:CBS domain-containing protein [Blastocatellia bacterium]
IEFSPTPIYDALLTQDGIRLPQAERRALKQLQVSAAMTEDVVTINDDLSVNEAFQYAQSFLERRQSYPVIDGAGRLVGLITLNDLKRALALDRGEAKLREVIGKNLELAHPDQTLDVAMIKLGRKGLSELPVVSRKDTSKLLGMITLHDIAEALSKDDEAERARSEK